MMVGTSRPSHATGSFNDVLERVARIWLAGPPAPEPVGHPPLTPGERGALTQIVRWALLTGRPPRGREIGPAFRHVRALRDRGLVDRRRLSLSPALLAMYQRHVDAVVRRIVVDVLADQERPS